MASEPEEIGVRKRLVLDANILLRGVFGIRVRSLLEAYESSVSFYAPDICFDDARKYIPNLAVRRKFDPTAGLLVLDALSKLVEPVDISLYESYEELAQVRISSAMRTTGRSSPLPYFWIVQFGLKTRISSVVASQLGPRTEVSSTYAGTRLGFAA